MNSAIIDQTRISEAVEEILQVEDLFLVEMIIKGNDNGRKLLVLIDGDNGLTIDQCGTVSRRLGNIIESEGLIDSKYTLEVSSPGLDHPLGSIRQYKKNVGRTLITELQNGDLFEGRLTKVDENSIYLEVHGEERKLPTMEIKQSKIKIAFK
ncbi:MAG: ribosome maturation factor RimP [Bacteroidota bacterium]